MTAPGDSTQGASGGLAATRPWCWTSQRWMHDVHWLHGPDHGQSWGSATPTSRGCVRARCDSHCPLQEAESLPGTSHQRTPCRAPRLPDARLSPCVPAPPRSIERPRGLARRAQAHSRPPGSGDTDRQRESGGPRPPGRRRLAEPHERRPSAETLRSLSGVLFSLCIWPDATKIKTEDDGQTGRR